MQDTQEKEHQVVTVGPTSFCPLQGCVFPHASFALAKLEKEISRSRIWAGIKTVSSTMATKESPEDVVCIKI